MDQQKKIEQLVLTCLDTAKAMLDEYRLVIPFGIRAFNDSTNLRMNCPAGEKSMVNWDGQIDRVVAELKECLVNEKICATALVTELESEGETGIGLQVETEMSSVLFIYPFELKDNEWIIDEPVQTDQLLATVF